MLTENCMHITFFDLSESFKFQFMASYFYHCVLMILIHSSEMQSGGNTIICRSNKYLHGLLCNLLCDFDKLQDRDKLHNVVLNSNTESLGVWYTYQSEISWFCPTWFFFDESLSFCHIFKTTWDTVRLAIKAYHCTEDSRMCL